MIAIPLTQEELENLSPGDIVRHKSGDKGYLVCVNFGGRVTAVDIADITNPDEWLLVSKAVREGIPEPKID